MDQTMSTVEKTEGSPWITLREAATYLRRTRPTANVHLAFLFRSGKIRGKKALGEWFTRREWLDAFINGGTK